MQCGPAPVSAIKEGDVYLGYDAKFIFSEVNGSRLTWKVVGTKYILVSVDDNPFNTVGKFISTKAVNSNERHDLTLDYKYADGMYGWQIQCFSLQ